MRQNNNLVDARKQCIPSPVSVIYVEKNYKPLGLINKFK